MSLSLKSEDVDKHRVISSMVGRDIHCHVHCHEEAERRLEVYSESLGGNTFLPPKLENVDSISSAIYIVTYIV